jgi:hypothetical protein
MSRRPPHSSGRVDVLRGIGRRSWVVPGISGRIVRKSRWLQVGRRVGLGEFSLLLPWIGHSIESFGCGKWRLFVGVRVVAGVLTLPPAVADPTSRCNTPGHPLAVCGDVWCRPQPPRHSSAGRRSRARRRSPSGTGPGRCQASWAPIGTPAGIGPSWVCRLAATTSRRPVFRACATTPDLRRRLWFQRPESHRPAIRH